MTIPSERLSNARKHESVARLVTYCERLVAAGVLPEAKELELRKYANEACVAFEMGTVAERVVRVGDHQPEKVA